MSKSLASIFTIFFLLTGSAMAGEATTSVLSVKGQAQVLRAGQTVQAGKGFVLQPNDEIVTEQGGSVDVGWAGLWGCRVLEGSRIKVSSLALEDQRVGMDRGAMLFRFKKLPTDSQFRLETPAAIAAVRGTVFLGKISSDGATSIAVASGRVELTPTQGEAVTISAGEAADVPAQGAAVKRAPTSEEQRILSESESIRTGAGSKDKSRKGYIG